MSQVKGDQGLGIFSTLHLGFLKEKTYTHTSQPHFLWFRSRKRLGARWEMLTSCSSWQEKPLTGSRERKEPSAPVCRGLMWSLCFAKQGLGWEGTGLVQTQQDIAFFKKQKALLWYHYDKGYRGNEENEQSDRGLRGGSCSSPLGPVSSAFVDVRTCAVPFSRDLKIYHCSCWLKSLHNLKVKSYVLFGTLSRTVAWNTAT